MFFFAKKAAEPAPTLADEEEGRGRSVLERLGVNGVLQKINDRADAIAETTQNYQTGLIVIAAGCAFILLSLLFLPLFVIRPYKFCALFSLGTVTILGGVVVTQGGGMARALLGRRYALFTLMFALSFACEFYFALISPQYLLVILFLALHSLSTLYLLLAAVPGGTRGLNAFFRLLFAAARGALQPAQGASL